MRHFLALARLRSALSCGVLLFHFSKCIRSRIPSLSLVRVPKPPGSAAGLEISWGHKRMTNISVGSEYGGPYFRLGPLISLVVMSSASWLAVVKSSAVGMHGSVWSMVTVLEASLVS